MSRSTYAKSRTRNAKGQFIKLEKMYAPETLGRYVTERQPFTKPKPSRNVLRLLSHHRVAIIGYTLYVILCLGAGFIGGFFGVRVGFR